MPITCDSPTLLDSAKCFECQIPNGMYEPIIIYLLCQIAGMNCDSASLLDAAKCYDCQIPRGMQAPIIIYLLCQIAGGGSVGSITSGNYGGGQPNFTPTVATAIAIDTSNGALWSWYNNAWH